MERLHQHHSGLAARAELPLPLAVADLLAIARARLGGAVSDGAWQRLAAVDDPLPPVASEAALELRLDDGGRLVDLELCLRAQTGARERVASALGTGEMAALCERVPGWRRARRFLSEWAEPRSVLHRAVPVCWLEFDLPPGGGAEPFVVVRLDPEYTHPEGRVDRAALDRILFGSLDLLAEGLDAATRSGVSDVVEALPRNALITHAAVRPTATGDIARLVLRMSGADLPDVLERLDWPGDRRELSVLLGRLGVGQAAYGINLDVAGGLGPRVGIEFHYPSPAARDPRWGRLLDELSALEACTSSARAVLEDWFYDPQVAEAQAEAAVTEDWFPLVVRRELLVKVVHESGCRPQAKAYLTFGPRLVSRS